MSSDLDQRGDGPGRLATKGDLTFEADSAGAGAGDLIFKTAGVERARIPNSGTKPTGLFVGLIDGQRRKQVLTDRGLMARVGDEYLLNTVSALTAGKITVSTLAEALYDGDVVTGVTVVIQGLPAGTGPTAFYVALLDKANKVLALSADVQATVTAASAGYLDLPAPYTVPAGTGLLTVRVALLQVGSWSVTQPTFGAKTAPVTQIGGGRTGKAKLYEDSAAAQTTIPAVGQTLTLAGNASVFFWASLY